MSDPVPTLKVFISYSWTDDDHIDWVVRLAERLVNDGVDVILDKWELKEGQDKYVFMERMVTDTSVSKVLAICDEMYASKADGRKGGVGTETQIISRDIYEKVNQEKFIPLIRERDAEGKEFIPVFFRNRKYIDFSHDDTFEESYDKLLRMIYDRPELKKPPLGQHPAHLFTAGATHVKTAGKLTRLKDVVQRGKPYVQAVVQEYLDLYVESMEDFRITYNRLDTVPFDERVVESITAFTPYRDNFVDFVSFVANYMDDDTTYDAIFAFLERIALFKQRPGNLSSWNEESFDNYRFILYELFLYLVATLIKNKKYQAALHFIDGEYQYTDTAGGNRHVKDGAEAFNQYARSLDELRKNRLQLGRISITADLVVERAKHPKITVADLVQADFLLFFLPALPGGSSQVKWYPRCIPFVGHGGSLEIFAKATTLRGFAAAGHLLKAKDLEHLYAKIQAAFKNQKLLQIVQSANFTMGVSLDDLLNLHAIAKQLGK